MCRFHHSLGTSVSKLLADSIVVDEYEPRSDDARESLQQLRAVLSGVSSELGDPSGLPRGAKDFRDLLLAAASNASRYLESVPDDAPIDDRRKAVDDVSEEFSFFDSGNSASRQFEGVVRNDTTNSCPELNEAAKP